MDEAGRGPLAGPVVVAAVILSDASIPGVADSKALSAMARERLFPEILARAIVAIAWCDASAIDRLNIRAATLLAMRRAVEGLAEAPDHVLVDGVDTPPGLTPPTLAIVGGDASCASIAAASIVAKVMRDRMMRRLDLTYPQYGFARHKGYPTAQHQRALAAHGPTPVHRHTFGGRRAARPWNHAADVRAAPCFSRPPP